MQDPIEKQLRETSYPDLARAVRESEAEILARWEIRVTEVLPDAEDLTLQQVRNNLPNALADIRRLLEAGVTGLTQALRESSREHGEARFHQEFNLAELLLEYDLLRQIVLEEVARRLGRMPSLDEVVALNMGLDLSARSAILTFVDFQKHELKAAGEAQARYLSFLSHDLRNHISILVGAAGQLRRVLADERQRDQAARELELLSNSLMTVSNLTTRFLRMEQLRRGEFEPDFQLADLVQVVRQTAEPLQAEAQRRGREIVLELPGEANARTDASLLQMVLQNLLFNALKHAPAGQIRMRLAQRSGAWRVSVSDQGLGLPQEAAERLSKPFANPPGKSGDGFGLGLSIVRDGARCLGLTLSIDSRPNEGTTFHLDFPVPQTHDDAASD